MSLASALSDRLPNDPGEAWLEQRRTILAERRNGYGVDHRPPQKVHRVRDYRAERSKAGAS